MLEEEADRPADLSAAISDRPTHCHLSNLPGWQRSHQSSRISMPNRFLLIAAHQQSPATKELMGTLHLHIDSLFST